MQLSAVLLVQAIANQFRVNSCLVLTILPSLDALYKPNKVDHKIWIKFLKETNLSVASALFDPWNMPLKNRIASRPDSR